MSATDTLIAPQRAQDRLEGNILTAQDVARILKIKVRTVQRYFESGTIPGKKVGSLWRCRAQDLDKYLS